MFVPVGFLEAATHDLQAIELGDGKAVDCILVIVGVGIVPNVEIAQAAGQSPSSNSRICTGLSVIRNPYPNAVA